MRKYIKNQKNPEILELEIHDVTAEGEGVAKFAKIAKIANFAEDGGAVFFVKNALTGETVRAQIEVMKKNYGKAAAIEILSPSKDRIKPPCALYGECGSCNFQHASYDFQLTAKAKILRDALARIGKLNLNETQIFPVEASPKQFAYRNKAIVPVRASAKNPFSIGYYRQNSHDIVALNDARCCVLCESIAHFLQDLCLFIPKLGIEAYDEAKKSGSLRELVIRLGENTQEMLLCLVMRKEPSKKEMSAIKNFYKQLCARTPQLKGMSVHVNPLDGNFVWSGREHCTLGAEKLTEKLDGFTLSYGASSFFQVNTPQAARLYQAVAAELNCTDNVLELYSGAGALTMYLAQKAKHVTAIEEYPPAAENLKANAAANGLAEKIKIFTGKAEEILPALAASPAENLNYLIFDAVVLDPPRGGCEKIVLDVICNFNKLKIIYISCNPATLARDAAIIAGYGYKLKSLHPFDLFPQTGHVETVAVFENLKI